MRYQVLVADDHAIIRDGLKKIMAETTDLVVAGEAGNGNDVLEMVRQRHWDLVLLDISMPGRNGLELVKLIKVERPKTNILVFSMHAEEQYAVRAIRAGAGGYLTKESDSELLLPAVRKVASGGMFINAKVAELLALDVSTVSTALPHTLLTDREFEIFGRIVRGESLTAIAASLSLSIKTVSTHKAHILSKMQMSNNVELVRYAMEHGIGENTRP
jgi:DNA-binding NarL/FixJ family response regulator